MSALELGFGIQPRKPRGMFYAAISFEFQLTKVQFGDSLCLFAFPALDTFLGLYIGVPGRT